MLTDCGCTTEYISCITTFSTLMFVNVLLMLHFPCGRSNSLTLVLSEYSSSVRFISVKGQKLTSTKQTCFMATLRNI